MSDTPQKHQDILDLVQYSLGRKRKTFGHGFEAGYHTVELDGVVYKGQRDTASRIVSADYLFENKTVLDIGCNIGGMLHALSSSIKYGVGLDNQYKSINAANRIAVEKKQGNVGFYTFDLAKDDWSMIPKFCPYEYDVVLVLSLALWVGSWRGLVDWVHPKDMLYESNGKQSFQDEQERYLINVYGSAKQLTEQSDDDARVDRGAKQRRLYLCTAC